MQRLQLSLQEEQAQYLARRAERQGVSMAEVVRRLLDDEARLDAQAGSDSILDIVGLFTDELPLINGIPVSVDPDLYLYGPEPDESSSVSGELPATISQSIG